MEYESKWVDVWHGAGFKRLRWREKMLLDYDLAFVTSEFFHKYESEKTGVPYKLKVTGYPRTDILIKGSVSREKILKKLKIPPNRKNILYAPTISSKPKPFFPWEKLEVIVDEIERFCEQNNCNFLIRMHHDWYKRQLKDVQKLKRKISQCKNIFDLSIENYRDVQPILYITDVLITDWSSIASDFLLLNRPIIFMDVELPAEDFVLGPEDRVGYIVKNKQEFFEKLKEALENPNLFEDKRKQVIKKYTNISTEILRKDVLRKS